MQTIEIESRNKIRKFIESNMSLFEDDIELFDSTNIFTNGFVNSTFAMRLLNFIESEFSVVVPDDEILLKNFCSIDAMWDLTYKFKENSCEAS